LLFGFFIFHLHRPNRNQIEIKQKTSRNQDTGNIFYDVINIVGQPALPSPLGGRGLG